MLKACSVTLLCVQLALGSAAAKQVEKEHPLYYDPFSEIGYVRKTDIVAVPYQVSLGRFNKSTRAYFPFCGGSIISQDWVITSANCLVLREGGDIGTNMISAGRTDVYDSTQTFHPVIETIFSSANGSKVDDIALLRVGIPFDFDATHQPVPLYEQDEEVQPGSIAIASGWGSFDIDRVYYLMPNDLRIGHFPIISKEDCSHMYEPYNAKLKEGQICAEASLDKEGFCFGDSGGPLTVGGRLVGIVSQGDCSCGPGIPRVYSEIAHYRDWIRKISRV